MNKKLYVVFSIIGTITLLIIYWNAAKPERPQYLQSIILFLTLVAALLYVDDTNKLAGATKQLADDTNKLAKYQSVQFRVMWIADIFRNFSNRLDAFTQHIAAHDTFIAHKDTVRQFLSKNSNVHIYDIDNYFDVMKTLFHKKDDKDFLSEQEKKFHNLWDGYTKTGDIDKEVFVGYISDFKKEMQKRIGNLME